MARQKSEAKREAIMKAAKKLFFKHNYAGVSMDTISHESGVSKNTLYSHFKNKNDLFRQVIQHHWNNEDVPALEVTTKAGVKKTLLVFSEQVINFYYRKDSRCFFRILIAESEIFPDLAQSLVKGGMPLIMSRLAPYLKEEFKLSLPKAKEAGSKLLGLLKEDCFWQVLVGLTKPYTKEQIKKHAARCVNDFLLLMGKPSK